MFGADKQQALASWTADAPSVDAGLVEDLARRAIETSSVQEAHQGDLHVISAPVFGKSLGPAVGAVAVAWDYSELRMHLLRANLARAALSLLAAGALILAIVSVVRRTVLCPISTLASAVERVSADGDVTTMPPDLLSRRDEVGRLAKEFRSILLVTNERITQQRKQLEVALEHMSQGLCVFDGSHRLALCNQRLRDIYELPEEATIPGTHVWDVIDAFKAAGKHTDQQVATLAKQLKAGQPVAYLDQLKNGRVISVVRVMLPDGGWVTTVEDVTEQHQVEVRLAHMAHHDALTGLPNRSMFRQELGRGLAGASHRHQLALLYLDLDGFKRVNDTLGHQIGDELLRAVAGRLRACVRSSAFIARLGGDEFVILETFSSCWDTPGALADRMIEGLSERFEIAGHRISIGTSVGIAVALHSRVNPDELLNSADSALYRAKSDGKGCYRYCEENGLIPELEPAVA